MERTGPENVIGGTLLTVAKIAIPIMFRKRGTKLAFNSW
jgi:hypothetical protein